MTTCNDRPLIGEAEALGQRRQILIRAAVLLSLGMGIRQSLGLFLRPIYVLGLAMMAAAGGAPALIAPGVLIGVALSCIASSLALTATARAIPEQRRSKVPGMVSAAGSLGTLLIHLRPRLCSRTKPGKLARCFSWLWQSRCYRQDVALAGPTGCREWARRRRQRAR